MMTDPQYRGRIHLYAPRIRPLPAILAVLIGAAFLIDPAFAHNVTPGDKGYILEMTGMNLLPFTYLGAKHMVTGYDHLLFLFGVIFFLYKPKHIGIYVSLFAIGHSVTLLFGVLFGTAVSSYVTRRTDPTLSLGKSPANRTSKYCGINAGLKTLSVNSLIQSRFSARF